MIFLLIFSSFIVPTYVWCANYPVFSIKDLSIAYGYIALNYMLLWLFLKILCRNKNLLLFLNYAIWGILWFALPFARWIRDAFCFDILKHSMVLKYQWLILLLLCVLVLIFILLFAIKFKSYIKKIISLLNIFSVIVFFMLVVQCLYFVIKYKFDEKCFSRNVFTEEKIRPNIYHILLDAFPNQPAMKCIGGDLSQFYNRLKNLGFIVFPNSRSNYYSTNYSVYSMVSLDYILGNESLLSNHEYYQLIKKSKLFKILAKEGYNLQFFCSPKLLEEKYPSCYVSRINRCESTFYFLYTLICFTPLKHYFEYIFSNQFKQDLIMSHKNVLNALTKVTKESNTFTFTHILCPHEPYVFGKNLGNSIFSGFSLTADDANLLTVENINNLKDNIYGIADCTIEVLEKLIIRFENKEMQPIIVLHSDHSCLNSVLKENSPLVTMDTIYGNLLAIYIPKEWHEDVNGLEFINLYRFLLNHLFSEKNTYLPQKQMYKGKEVMHWPPEVL